MTTAYPPHRLHTTTQISPSQALTLLSAYLHATTTDPSLHPNALLTDNGPITPSSGSTTGLVLHNLKRVEAGLRGEHLAADLTFEKFGGEGLPGLMPVGGGSEGGKEVVGGAKEADLDLGMEGGWQDKEEFEREQEVVQGELGNRENGVGAEAGEEGGQVPTVRATKSGREIEQRRKMKKERKIRDRKEREAKRKREKDAEG
ncbi:hypothetical protein N7G274_007019 [Stereocaulon virgatum]|uniref:Uncharacterized protein n=1 Tax=Stereocaulon virgatum TaxID=373712 RepID=A0ABR4A5B9_9LECA